jgi:hypothetical protein
MVDAEHLENDNRLAVRVRFDRACNSIPLAVDEFTILRNVQSEREVYVKES